MTFNENQESKELSIDSLFKNLENPENSLSYQLERIEYTFNDASPENTQLCTVLIDNICSNDESIKEKWWNFLKTLEKIKLETV